MLSLNPLSLRIQDPHRLSLLTTVNYEKMTLSRWGERMDCSVGPGQDVDDGGVCVDEYRVGDGV